MNVKELFLQAVELPAEQRDAFVDQQCAGDAALRSAVNELLAAHDRLGGFLSGPGVETTGPATATIASPLAVPVPRQIGPYKLLQVIGEGGFGTVYLAEQQQPVRRRVALKVIKLGMDTRQVIARFEAERQALAMMDHPNIAKVFDAGATDTGRPYFVMELVNGIPLTQYCDANHLTPRQRLELFVPICQAVQHAHSKGIIHRDIKPSNVLVTLHDGKPVPKVIDFGIAKATQARLTEKTLFTEFRQMIGTPEYMSPEQAEMSGLDIDTRSDVYSLGVLLYELLTGATPFDPKELRSKAFAEMQRVIREVEPPKPSTRLSTLETLASVAAQRGVAPAKLSALVRGELDWIVMRCLEKDRTRRYETAAALSADVQRYLADEPVSASPPSTAYLLRKLVRRHRGPVTAAAAVLAVLVIGLAVSLRLYALESRAHARALAAEADATRQRDAALAARHAEAQAREYERQTDKFLTEMFTAIDPEKARGRPVLVQDVLDDAARRIDAEPPSHKIVEGSLRFTFAQAYLALGLLEKARVQAERALEAYRAGYGNDRNLSVMRTQNLLGNAYTRLGRGAEAERSHRASLDLHRQLLGDDHPDTIAAQANLGLTCVQFDKLTEADALLADSLQRMKRADPGKIDVQSQLQVTNNLATLREQQGRYAEAETLLRDALAIARVSLGAEDPYCLALANNLSDLLRTMGRVTEAVTIQREVLDLARKIFGADNPDTLSIANNLALALDTLGADAEAQTLYTDTIERRRRTLGDDHPGTINVRQNFALHLQRLGRYDEAQAIFRDAAQRLRRTLGENHRDTIIAENNLGWLQVQAGDVASAEQIFRALLPRVRAALGAQHPAAISIEFRLGHVLCLQGRWDQAEPLLAEAYAGAVSLGIHDRQAGYASAYGICLVERGKSDEALPILQVADRAARNAPRADPTQQRRVADAMARAYQQLNRPQEAELWRARAEQASTSPATASTLPMQPVPRP
ncbi:tetratricopeptide repeat protein [Fontivita pretiosa]|uniref:tetratricopeptide repeat protein n=1 Tax=Fontivita pretiosa TaxID=2989684 RepID=UPI003D17CE9E